MARDRSIVLRLKAEISDFQAKMGQASRSLSDFEREQQKMGGAATTTLGRMVQSAKANEQAWQTTGRTLLGVGTAITGIGVAALKTGIEYNTLQQTSRAALTTIMGGAKQANQQMDKLDDFARNSPFAKQVFIQAQQQMLGFGIEARKVIPYMDAIQNAVAATGGSNQDIAELSRVFSQVSANAKITARDLMMFGQRGVDAATIIGSQMGKTGAEIRSEITAGTLDAHEALDALAAGMEERFGGAAANVKNTMDGAWDRVKAAWRDLSAELAAPLVGPEGGGFAIDFLNSLADAMRAFQNAPQWVKGGTAALGALTGAAAIAAGTFAVGLPKYIAYKDAVAQLAATHPTVAKLDSSLSKLAGTAVRLGIAFGATVAVTAGVKSLMDHLQGFDGVNMSVSTLETKIKNLSGSTGAYQAVLGDLVGNVRLNTEEFGNFADAVETAANPNLADRFFMWLKMDASGIGNVTDRFRDLGVALEQIAATDLPAAQDAFSKLWQDAGGTEEAFANLMALMPGFRDHLVGLAEASGYATTDSVLLKIATGELRVATDEATGAIEGEVSALEQLRIAHREAADATLASLNSEIRFRDSLDRTTKGLEENGKGLDLTTEKGRANQSMLNDLASAGYAFVDSAKDQEAAMQEVRDAFIKAGQDAGMTKGEVSALADELGLIPGDYVAEIEADDSGARATFGRLKGDWERTTTETNLSANTDPAKDLARALMGDWKNTTTETFLDADPGPAVRVFNEETRKWENTTTDTLLSADPGKAVAVFNRETGKWERTTVRTHLGLNTSGATATLNAWKANNASFTVYANVQTRGGVATGAAQNLGKFHGGKVGAGLAAGGKVPGPRASYDNVLWPLHSGGQTLQQPLSGGEWVINSAMSQRYDRELGAMNRGTYPASGGGHVTAVLSAEDRALLRAVVSRPVSVSVGGREFASAQVNAAAWAGGR